MRSSLSDGKAVLWGERRPIQNAGMSSIRSMMAVACVAEDTDSQDCGDKYVLNPDTETADTYSIESLSSRSSTNVAPGNK